MSVVLQPSNFLGFRRPLTTVGKRSLTVTNQNAQPIAFKVKTTAPKLYCVRPNSGRVEPGESVEVSVMLQGMKEEPPMNAKCKDKFLLQSTIITPEKETLPLNEIWSSPDTGNTNKIYEQKLRVTYLPADGVEEEEEPGQPQINQAGQPLPGLSVFSNGTTGDSRFETIRPNMNGQHEAVQNLFGENSGPVPRAITPGQDYSVAREQPIAIYTGPDAIRTPSPLHQQERKLNVPQSTFQHEPIVVSAQQSFSSPIAAIPQHQPFAFPPPQPPIPAQNHFTAPQTSQPQYQLQPQFHSPPRPQAPSVPSVRQSPPTSVSAPAPAPATQSLQIIYKENPLNEELALKLNSALAEVDRLKATLATASVAPPSSGNEIRRRKATSDDGSSVAGDTDVTTVVDEPTLRFSSGGYRSHAQEGVPLQIVVIIAVGVFITTYLFF